MASLNPKGKTKKKFVSKLRDKFAGKAKEGGGRSLKYADINVENYYDDYKEVTLPKEQRNEFNQSIKQKMKDRAAEILSEGTKRTKDSAKDSAKEIHKGLTGIRHPAQLIPMAKGASTLAGIIRALTKK